MFLYTTSRGDYPRKKMVYSCFITPSAEAKQGSELTEGTVLTAKKTKEEAAMGESGQRSRPWPGPGDAGLTPPEPAAAADARGEAPTLRDFGTSMDAISFGFAATAILISIFQLMAIFEHLIRPQAPPDSPRGRRRHSHRSPGKPRSPPMVETVLQAAGLSVLMPGQRYPHAHASASASASYVRR